MPVVHKSEDSFEPPLECRQINALHSEAHNSLTESPLCFILVIELVIADAHEKNENVHNKSLPFLCYRFYFQKKCDNFIIRVNVFGNIAHEMVTRIRFLVNYSMKQRLARNEKKREIWYKRTCHQYKSSVLIALKSFKAKFPGCSKFKELNSKFFFVE